MWEEWQYMCERKVVYVNKNDTVKEKMVCVGKKQEKSSSVWQNDVQWENISIWKVIYICKSIFEMQNISVF